MELRRLWIALVVVVVASFAVLIGVGAHAIRGAPPSGRDRGRGYLDEGELSLHAGPAPEESPTK